MNTQLCTVAALLLTFASATAAAGTGETGKSPSTAVGSNDDDLNITSTGAAAYELDIAVPPGVQGAEPDLEFSYQSGRGNGIMGVGWTLSGLSSISRVAQVIAIDGRDGAVTHSRSDRFALRGKRMLAVDGKYGTADSVYRTELDDLTRITARGQAGAGPRSFRVQTRKGAVRIYGGTRDSRVLAADGTTVRKWLLSSETDAKGNTVEYTYSTAPDGATDHASRAYPVKIAYNRNESGSADLAPNRSVRFAYEKRPDPIRHFKAGTEIHTKLRLAHVRTYLQDNLVSDYRVSYETSPSSGHSRVTSIQRHGAADDAADDDAVARPGLAPSKFSYQDGKTAFGGRSTALEGHFTKSSGWGDHDKFPITVADVNGDGYMDIVGFKNGVQVALGTGDGYREPTTWIEDFSVRYNWSADEPRRLADINGDGLADIVGFSDTGVVYAYAEPESKSFKKAENPFPHFAPSTGWSDNAPRYVADVNGDRAMDLVGMDDGVTVALARRDGSGFHSPKQWSSRFGVRQGFKPEGILTADVNGDGKSDVVAMDQRDRSIHVALSTGSEFSTDGWDQGYSHFVSSSKWNADNPRMLGDVNGDGMADLVGFGTQVQVGLSNGSGFEEPEVWSRYFVGPQWDRKTPRKLLDVNADGRADVLGVGRSEVKVALSTGVGFDRESWNQASLDGLSLDGGGSVGETQRMMADANGDGIMDMVAITPRDVSFGLSAGPYPDLMTEVQRPEKGRYEITYRPISDSSVYSEKDRKGSRAHMQAFRPRMQNAAIPVYHAQQKLRGRRYVVAEHVTRNNPALSKQAFAYRISHFYRDARVSNLGRGWLGYASTRHINHDKHRVTVNEYHQTFPLLSRIKSRTVRCAPGGGIECSAGDLFHRDHFEYHIRKTVQSTVNATSARLVRKARVQTDRFEGSDYRFSTARTFSINEFGERTRIAHLNRVSRKGKDIDPDDTYYTHMAYAHPDGVWSFDLRRARKVTKESGTPSFDSFDPDKDYRLHRWKYDDERNPIRSRKWDDGKGDFLLNKRTFDDFGNRTSVTKPDGARVDYAIEKTYRTYRQTMTHPPNAHGERLKEHYGHDARYGTRVLHVDESGNQFTTCYDHLGRRASTQGPAPDRADKALLDKACLGPNVARPAHITPAQLVTLKQYEHKWHGQVPTSEQHQLTSWQADSGKPRRLTTVTHFDGLGRDYERRTQSSVGGDADRILEALRYDYGGNVRRRILAHRAGTTGHELVYERDAYGRIARTKVPWMNEGSITQVASTRSHTTTDKGRRITESIAEGTPFEATRIVDEHRIAHKSRRVSIKFRDKGSSSDDIGSGNGTTIENRYDYNRIGKLTALGQGEAGQDFDLDTTFAYDSLGRVIRRTRPGLGTQKVVYGANGRVAKRSDATGTTTYDYDKLRRRTLARYPGGPTIRYSYDGDHPNGTGRLAVATVSGQPVRVTQRYRYNGYGDAITRVLQAGRHATPLPTRRQYDPWGRLTRATGPNGTEVRYDHHLDHLSRVAVAGRTKVAYGDFTAFGQPQTVKYANGVNTDVSYTPRLGIRRISTHVKGNPLFTETYDPTPWGYPHRISGQSTQWGEYTREFDFENVRLVGHSDSRVDTGGDGQTYGYDAQGNLRKGPGLEFKVQGQKLAAGSTIDDTPIEAKYDGVGNLTAATIPPHRWEYGFDGRNRLTIAEADSGDSLAFAYDHRGRRVWKRDASGNVERYASRRFTALGDRGDPGVEIALGGPFGPSYTGSGGKGGDGAPERFIHPNARRSATAVTGSSGKDVAWIRYGVYGTPSLSGQGESSLPRHLFLGREYDVDTGLYYYHSRYFQPALARFIRADTRFGDSRYRHDAGNRYAFLMNNPVWRHDPSGHGATACFTGMGAGISGTTGGSALISDKGPSVVSVTATAGGVLSLVSGASACYNWIKKVRDNRRARNNASDDGSGDDGSGDGGSGDGGGRGGGDASDDDGGDPLDDAVDNTGGADGYDTPPSGYEADSESTTSEELPPEETTSSELNADVSGTGSGETVPGAQPGESSGSVYAETGTGSGNLNEGNGTGISGNSSRGATSPGEESTTINADRSSGTTSSGSTASEASTNADAQATDGTAVGEEETVESTAVDSTVETGVETGAETGVETGVEVAAETLAEMLPELLLF